FHVKNHAPIMPVVIPRVEGELALDPFINLHRFERNVPNLVIGGGDAFHAIDGLAKLLRKLLERYFRRRRGLGRGAGCERAGEKTANKRLHGSPMMMMTCFVLQDFSMFSPTAGKFLGRSKTKPLPKAKCTLLSEFS